MNTVPFFHISVVLVWTVWVKVIGNVALKGVERPEVFGSGPVEHIQDFTDSSLCCAHLLLDKSLWISSFGHRGALNIWMAWWNRHRLSIRSRVRKPKFFFFFTFSGENRHACLCKTWLLTVTSKEIFWFLDMVRIPLFYQFIVSGKYFFDNALSSGVVWTVSGMSLTAIITLSSQLSSWWDWMGSLLSSPQIPLWFPDLWVTTEACYVIHPWFTSWLIICDSVTRVCMRLLWFTSADYGWCCILKES